MGLDQSYLDRRENEGVYGILIPFIVHLKAGLKSPAFYYMNVNTFLRNTLSYGNIFQQKVTFSKELS